MQTAVAAQPCMASYSVAAFNALPEFDASKTRFPKKAHALDKFAEIIRRYRVQKYLGAALIHKHYPLYDGERMIEEMNANGSVIAPHRGISEGLLTPYLWHLEIRVLQCSNGDLLNLCSRKLCQTMFGLSRMDCRDN